MSTDRREVHAEETTLPEHCVWSSGYVGPICSPAALVPVFDYVIKHTYFPLASEVLGDEYLVVPTEADVAPVVHLCRADGRDYVFSTRADDTEDQVVWKWPEDDDVGAWPLYMAFHVPPRKKGKPHLLSPVPTFPKGYAAFAAAANHSWRTGAALWHNPPRLGSPPTVYAHTIGDMVPILTKQGFLNKLRIDLLKGVYQTLNPEDLAVRNTSITTTYCTRTRTMRALKVDVANVLAMSKTELVEYAEHTAKKATDWLLEEVGPTAPPPWRRDTPLREPISLGDMIPLILCGQDGNPIKPPSTPEQDT